MKKAPAAVVRAPERLRSNNATPSLLSSSCTLRVTVDCDMSSAAAALLKLPRSATTIAYRRYLRSKAISGTNFLPPARSEEHTSELQSLMRISYAVFCLKKKNKHQSRSKQHKAKPQSSKQHQH